jgi:alpha-tubulin suppressor-like RCC1 family protein
MKKIVFILICLSAFAEQQTVMGQAIAGGAEHSLAICSNGTVQSWGGNQWGELGNGTLATSTVPVAVSTLTGIISVAAGFGHSVALKNDGTVWAWGWNYYGQLGDSTTTDRLTPVQVSMLTGITAITAGSFHCLALKNDGTVWAWGYNAYGQLGDSTIADSHVPVQVNIFNGIVMLAGGGGHSLALKNDGTVWAWGENGTGELGNGTTTSSLTPVQVSALTGITSIAAWGANHSMAVKNDGTVWTWGLNTYGQLGIGSSDGNPHPVPVQVSTLTGITAVASGTWHILALKNDSSVWAWGNNQYGQLGDGTSTDRWIPIQVNLLSGITEVAAGSEHSLSIKNDGTARSWGRNIIGKLGDGTTINQWVPVQVINLCPLPTLLPDNLSSPASGFFLSSMLNNGVFTITMNNAAVKHDIEIFNSLGKKVHQEIIESDKQTEIHLNNPQAGIYFVSVREGEKVFVKKMVVQP